MAVPRLDRVGFSRLNLRVRIGALCLLFVAGSVAAAPHPRPSSIAFTVGKGGETLAYVTSELGRVVALALAEAGVELPPAETAGGKLDALGGERLRLSISLRGRPNLVVVEG